MRFKCVSVDYTLSDCVARLGSVNMPVGLVDIHGCAVCFLCSVIIHGSRWIVCVREREREGDGGREAWRKIEREREIE